jgi:hypothetical protein
MSSVRRSSGHDDFPCTNVGQDVTCAADRAVGCTLGRSDGPIRSAMADPTDDSDQVRQIRRKNTIGCGRSDGRIPSGAADPMEEYHRVRQIRRTKTNGCSGSYGRRWIRLRLIQ